MNYAEWEIELGKINYDAHHKRSVSIVPFDELSDNAKSWWIEAAMAVIQRAVQMRVVP